MNAKQTYTTDEIASRYGVNISKVIAWIKSGDLAAINVARCPHGERPRYRITQEALEAFERARTVTPHQKAKPARRCKRPEAPKYV